MQIKEEGLEKFKKIIYAEIAKLFGKEALRLIRRLGYNIILLGRGNNVYEAFLVNNELKELLSIMKKINIQNPFSIGLFVGTIIENKSNIAFKVGLDLMEYLAQQLRRNIVIVSDDAAKLFLYGRDILLNSIIKILPPISYLTVIANKELEILGIAKPLVNLETFIREGRRGNIVALKNVVDKGWYLRKGG
ncbi:MAG TPA: hypothetical protein EYH40_02540 [Desulfurococcales archaeon]|nr:hypothetical protein [Desulfurococcales archaeon]